MSLFDRADFEAHVLSFPKVEIVRQWDDASVGKIGGKIFAILSVWTEDDAPLISFKCSDMSFEMLPEEDGIARAKYLARAKWVEVRQGSVLGEDDIRAYIGEAYRLISEKLPKKTRAELGL